MQAELMDARKQVAQLSHMGTPPILALLRHTRRRCRMTFLLPDRNCAHDTTECSTELHDKDYQWITTTAADPLAWDTQACALQVSHTASGVGPSVFVINNKRGKFLALDLGGTNFRVLVIHLSEKHFDMKAKIFAIPQKIMVGTGTQLFDHIAECLVAFVKEHQLHTEVLPLGFTFSFPLMQKGLSVGILERWTKGFNCSGVIGQDVVQMLRDALDKKPDVKINIAAVLNDTTGTLMSCAWKDHNTKVGLIIGTGTNSCYVEKTENAELFDGDRSKPYVIINTESGAFGDDGKLNFIRTEYDKDVDDNSINPGRQLHEKMISGMYMGEIVRLIGEKALKMNAILGGKGSDAFLKRGGFFTKYVSEIESDKPGSYTNVKRIMNELGLPHATEQDFIDFRHMCEAVSTRAGVMVSASMATLLNKMGFEQATIGIDGSLYRFHPGFADLMTRKISQLVKPGIKFKLMLSEDGSGRGAALVAAVASRGD
ncbi:hexokinase type 2-like [Schistocerca nitens]|uniref:hexokinase type 2-like n=1 Tax=Schistocerca nitens TaxID=7011 RepID=UPI002117F79F|nr:hexokinase type 2-like [Schistocerca nitens]